MRIFEWVKKEKADGESSTIKEAKNPTLNEKVHELPSMFDSLARIAEKRNIEISLNVTFRKGKVPSEDNEKGNGLAWCTYIPWKQFFPLCCYVPNVIIGWQRVLVTYVGVYLFEIDGVV